MNQSRDTRANRKGMFSSNEHFYNITPSVPYQGLYQNTTSSQNVKDGVNVGTPAAARYRCMSVQNPTVQFANDMTSNVGINMNMVAPFITKPPPKNNPFLFNKHKDYGCMQNEIMRGYAFHKNVDPNNCISLEKKGSQPKENKLHLNVNHDSNDSAKISINTVVDKCNTKTVPCLKYKGANCNVNLGWWNYQERSQLYKAFENYKKNIKKKYEESRQICNNRSLTLMNNNTNKVFPNEYFYIPATNKKIFRSKSKAKVTSEPVSDFHKLNLKPLTGFLQSHQKQKEKDNKAKPAIIKVSSHPLVIADYPNIYKERKRLGLPFNLGKAEIMMVDDEGENIENTKGLFVSVSNNTNGNGKPGGGNSGDNSGMGGTKGIMIKCKNTPTVSKSGKNRNNYSPKQVQIRINNREIHNPEKTKLQVENVSSENSYTTSGDEMEAESNSESNASESLQNVRINCKNRKNDMNKIKMKTYTVKSYNSSEYCRSDLSSEEHAEGESENEESENEESENEESENEEYENEEYEDEEYKDERYDKNQNERGYAYHDVKEEEDESGYLKELRRGSSNYSDNEERYEYQLEDKAYSKGNDMQVHTDIKRRHANDKTTDDPTEASPHFHDHRYSNPDHPHEFEQNQNMIVSIENSTCSDEKEHRKKYDIYEKSQDHPNRKGRYKMLHDATNDRKHRKPTYLKQNNDKSKIKNFPSYVKEYPNEKREAFNAYLDYKNNLYVTYNNRKDREPKKEYSREKNLDSFSSGSKSNKHKSNSKKINNTQKQREKNNKKKHDMHSDSCNSCIETYMRKRTSKCVNDNNSEDSTEAYITSQKNRQMQRKSRTKNTSSKFSNQSVTDSSKFKPKTETTWNKEKNKIWRNKSLKMLKNDDYLEKKYEENSSDV